MTIELTIILSIIIILSSISVIITKRGEKILTGTLISTSLTLVTIFIMMLFDPNFIHNAAQSIRNLVGIN